MLSTLGISEFTESVYRAMLADHTWSVQQLALRLGATEKQIRQALDQLAELALLTDDGSSGGMKAVGPSVGLSALLAQAETEMAERQRQIAATREAIAAIAFEQERQAQRESSIRLEGLDAVRARIEELSRTVRTECLSLNPRSAQTPDAKAASTPLNQQMVERGVALRCIYQESYRNDPALVAYANWLTGLGGRLRTASTIPMLTIVYDREIALLPLDPANSRLGAVEVRSPALVAAVYALFEQIWAGAVPFGETAPLDANGLQPQEKQLLELLSSGQTDELAARKLGVSLRTVRRIAADLMERLGARSRFQAGLEAGRRGWL
ncbi:LuxR C-terminal-related transcriptional regulator [Catellatospora sp. KI3]|uniref:LuxR C-terminal-related transcriptional regulator n=1 Tax=Catellatospora sp. KI3 TaxID=3041620 RepID=UPI002482B07D|nr:LuxR C-terminal-related transcriptional regulator [Catellatospora sp. KI3]MDI1461296.1 LuxR C-terminal-related transcriptional regulator [Catellatospora sp. KI3]